MKAKRILSGFLCLLMILGLFAGALTQAFAEETGEELTEQNPTEVSQEPVPVTEENQQTNIVQEEITENNNVPQEQQPQQQESPYITVPVQTFTVMEYTGTPVNFLFSLYAPDLNTDKLALADPEKIVTEYDIYGNPVKTLADEETEAGYQYKPFAAGPGNYYIVLSPAYGFYFDNAPRTGYDLFTFAPVEFAVYHFTLTEPAAQSEPEVDKQLNEMLQLEKFKDEPVQKIGTLENEPVQEIETLEKESVQEIEETKEEPVQELEEKINEQPTETEEEITEQQTETEEKIEDPEESETENDKESEPEKTEEIDPEKEQASETPKKAGSNPALIKAKAPVQTISELEIITTDVDLKTGLVFESDESSYALGNGSSFYVEGSVTVADAETAKGFMPAAESNGIVSTAGKYYLVYSPTKTEQFADGSEYAVFEFTVTFKYEITEGANAKWTIGSSSTDGLIFTCNGNYDDFRSVEIDGTALSSNDYSSWSGSTVIHVKPSKLNSLADGSHTITIRYADGGFASAPFIIVDPQLIPVIADSNPPTESDPHKSEIICENTGFKIAPVVESAKIKSRLYIKNLTPGNMYTVRVGAVEAETGTPVMTGTGDQWSSSSKFYANESTVDAELHFTINTLDLAGKNIAIVAELLFDEKVVADNSNDTARNIMIPAISTQATCNDIHEVLADTDTEIKDKVHFTNLLPGQTYTITATMLDVDSGEFIRDANKEILTTKFGFTLPADRTTGYVTVPITLNTSKLAGHTLVVFESLSLNDIQLVSHEDKNDKEQTVYLPAIETEATVQNEHYAMASAATTIKDTVSYSNLIPGTTYTVQSKLAVLDKSDAKGFVMIQKDGSDVIKTTEFTPENASGKTDISFTFDASQYAGKSVVVFEEIYKDSVLVAQHADPDDLKQTVNFVKIYSKLTDTNGNKSVNGETEVSLIDTVFYENLISGETYTLNGTLCDPQTGGEVLDDNGKEIKASATFTPRDSSGSVTLQYDFYGTKFIGKTLVATAQLMKNSVMIAEHADYDDTYQTIYFPSIQTVAHNGNGQKQLSASKNASVVDDVYYSGLKPFAEYTLKGVLIDAETGEPALEENGAESRSTLTFRADETGVASATFYVDATKYFGKDLAVCEELYDGNVLVASEYGAGIEDQTVTIEIKPAVYKKDATSKLPVAGAVIRFKDLTDNVETELVTDNEGIAYYPLINGHKYSYKETKAPDGYKLNGNTYYYNVDNNGNVNKDAQTLYDQKIGTVVIKKINVKTGAPLAGAQLSVYNAANELLSTQTTDQFGQIYFDAFTYMKIPEKASASYAEKFAVKEIKAPTGYYLNSDLHTFSVTAEGKVSGNTVISDCPLGTIAIKKTNAYGSPLAGARISVYSSAGKIVGQATTNQEGKIYFAAPDAGTYYFIEDQAPYGYARVDSKFAFSIDSAGTVTGTTSFVNQIAGYNGNGVATGDNNSLALFGGIAAGSLVICAGVYFFLLKNKKRNSGDSEPVAKENEAGKDTEKTEDNSK